MTILGRRDFLWFCAGATVGLYRASPILHFTLLGGGTDARRGARMGVDEALRAASIFGGDVSFASSDGTPAVLRLAVGTDAKPIDFLLDDVPRCRADTFVVAPPAGQLAWHSSLTRFGADTLNTRYETQYHAPMTSEAWCAWFSVKCAWEAALKSRATTAPALAAYLERPTARFDGHKGVALHFDASHRLVQPVYDARGNDVDPHPRPACDWK